MPVAWWGAMFELGDEIGEQPMIGRIVPEL